MAFVCESLDASTGQCATWTEAVTVPPLTIAQGLELSSVVVGCWAVAYAARFVLHFFLNKR